MTPKDNSIAPVSHISLVARMVIGGGIGLLLISLFLLTAGEPNPAWVKLWMLKPMIIVPLAGAMGGLCNYYIVHFHYLIGLNKTVAVIVSGLVFIVGLWLGIVLGLNGTYWN